MAENLVGRFRFSSVFDNFVRTNWRIESGLDYLKWKDMFVPEKFRQPTGTGRR